MIALVELSFGFRLYINQGGVHVPYEAFWTFFSFSQNLQKLYEVSKFYHRF